MSFNFYDCYSLFPVAMQCDVPIGSLRSFDSCIDRLMDKMHASASVFTLPRHSLLRVDIVCARREVTPLQRFFNLFRRARLTASTTRVR
ncbi:hypothetical protein [Burkholderia stabilis]|uniref:hypothetical protein n=2 Tax=Burkholderia TaxID=32008 RepID=UPI001013327F|nr:hypothetical protein [Burkholderia stabilis]